jgi:hypothetical protein
MALTTADVATITVLISRLARMLQDKDKPTAKADWDALKISQDVTSELLRDAAKQGGYTVPTS